MNESSKACKICNEVKPLDSFTPQRKGLLGRMARCRACVNDTRRAATPQQRADRRAATARYRAKNPGADAAQQRVSRMADPERFRAYDKAWRDRNPDRIREKNFQRRSIVQQFRRGVVAYAWIRATFTDCYLCGGPLSGSVEYDHVIPLKPRKGDPQGAHSTGNLRPTHRACNKRKSNIPLRLLDWYSGPTDIGEQYEEAA